MSQYPTVSLAHSAVSVGTSTTEIVASNDDRRYVLLQNVGDDTVVLQFGVPAVAADGIYLYPGTTLEIKPVAGQLDTRAINGIALSGTQSIRVMKG